MELAVTLYVDLALVVGAAVFALTLMPSGRGSRASMLAGQVHVAVAVKVHVDDQALGTAGEAG